MVTHRIPTAIGTLNEKPLHAALKEWYSEPDDRFESHVEGFVIDIVRGDLLIEIQTRNFSKIKRKLATLTRDHPVRLVYPIAKEKWIVKLPETPDGRTSRRKSPKRGSLEEIFEELVYLPRMLADPNFSLEVLLIQEEETRRHDSTRGWRRRGWVTHERRLLEVVERHQLAAPADAGALVPEALVEPFTTSELAAALGKPPRLAGQMAYCLRKMEVLSAVGKRGNAILHARAQASRASADTSRDRSP